MAADMNFIVVGDAMLDRYYEGPVARISPEASCPLVDIQTVMLIPGGAANVASNLVALEHRVHFVTVLGGRDDDEGAAALRNWFEGCTDISLHAYHFSGFRTPIKNRVCDSNGTQLLRFDQEDHKPFWDKAVNAAIIKETEELLRRMHDSKKPTVLILSDYAKGVLVDDEVVGKILAIARDLSIPSIVDPKALDFRRYYGATILKPNRAEAQAVLGPDALGMSPMKCAMSLLETLHPAIDAVVVTAGAAGLCLASHSGKDFYMEYAPAYPARQFYNAVGAGDTVTALLAEAICCTSDDYPHIHQLDREQLLRVSIGAGVVTGKPNTAILSRDELLNAMEDYGVIEPHKITTVDKTAEMIEEARGDGEEIILANGCFDMLHPGHLHLLKEAKSIGGLLVVAVNDDDSVTRCKGPGRPLIPLEERAKALEALECVDAVVAFKEDTPEEVIRKLKPDWLVKGAEYYNPEGSPEDIPGAAYVIQNGRGVRFISMLGNYSTSRLLNKDKTLAGDQPSVATDEQST